MLPPTMNNFKESPTTPDFFLVQSLDVCDPKPKEETFVANHDTITEEDPSYYFQDAIFLVCDSSFANQFRSMTLLLGREHILQSPATPVRAELGILL
jgi:hypothetical protein